MRGKGGSKREGEIYQGDGKRHLCFVLDALREPSVWCGVVLIDTIYCTTLLGRGSPARIARACATAFK